MMEKVSETKRLIAALAFLTAVVGPTQKFMQYQIDKIVPQPRPPIFRDVGDGKLEKIVEERIIAQGILGFLPHAQLIQKILYEIEIGNTKIYVPKEVYDQYMKYKNQG